MCINSNGFPKNLMGLHLYAGVAYQFCDGAELYIDWMIWRYQTGIRRQVSGGHLPHQQMEGVLEE